MTARSELDPGLLAGSLLMLVAASAAAVYLSRRLEDGKDAAAPIEALILMLLNLLQLMAVVFSLIAIVGE